ncbi:MAG TPA: hypothetical protein VGY58_23055, partial [Gemmataceae bacterium]|nr:hypothetical protein [Gemmataceae bacterium]
VGYPFPRSGRHSRDTHQATALPPAIEALEDRSLPHAGLIDQSFGVAGQVVLDLGAGYNGSTAAAASPSPTARSRWQAPPIRSAQGDGKIILTGTGWNKGSPWNWSV